MAAITKYFPDFLGRLSLLSVEPLHLSNDDYELVLHVDAYEIGLILQHCASKDESVNIIVSVSTLLMNLLLIYYHYCFSFLI